MCIRDRHIGAYQIEFEHESEKKKLTFLDTPGHEAFTLSGDAPSLSILFIATTIGTFAALA